MRWLRLGVGCRDCGPHPHIRQHPRFVYGVGSLIVLETGVGRRAVNGGGAVQVTGRGGFRLAPFLGVSGKEGLEFFLRLVIRCRPLPVFAVLDERSCLKDELECVGYDLEWGVGIVARIRIFDSILDLFK